MQPAKTQATTFDRVGISVSTSFAAGADVKVIQSMLGHASAAMTLDRYGHLLPSAAASVAERLDVMARAAVAARPRAASPIRPRPPRGLDDG